MNKVALGLLGSVAVLAVAAVIGPSFVDWNKYKPEIIAQAKKAAGYNIQINGDIALSLLPAPHVRIEGLTIAAPRGDEPTLLSVKKADISLQLLPLLSGAVKIDTVHITQPEVHLQTLADGENSWLADKVAGDTASDVKGKSEQVVSNTTEKPTEIALDKLTIEDGVVSYTDKRNGSVQTVEKINLDLGLKSMQGPFSAKGSVSYTGHKFDLDVQTERETDRQEIPLDAKISLDQANTRVSFKGIVAPKTLEAQGKVDIATDNLNAIVTAAGAPASPALGQKFSFSGLITSNAQSFKSQDVDMVFGGATAKGNITIDNLKDRNPIKLAADMSFGGTIDLDAIPQKGGGDEGSVEERVAKGQKLSATSGLIPETITLPFPIDAAIHGSADAIKANGMTIKGVTFSLAKNGPALTTEIKALDFPGKSSGDATLKIAFGSSSVVGKGVIYSDPDVSFVATATSDQFPTLLRAVTGQKDDNPAYEIWKTGRADLSGTITPKAVVLGSSTLKLDQTTIGLNGSYKPNGANGRPDVAVDITTDTIDADYIQSRLNGQKKQAVQKSTGEKPDLKTAVKPLKDFDAPVNATFDLSAQKIIYNGQPVNGIRIKGKAAGRGLNLDVASAQSYLGGTFSVKGAIADMAELKGVDISAYGRTTDLKTMLQSFKVDTTKLPATINTAEGTVNAKGSAGDLSFDAKISALGGELDASGKATNILDQPTVNDLTIGAKHPNLVKAIQIINPGFNGGAGLEQPFEIHAKAVQNGKVYDLSGLKATLGPTAISGALKVDLSAARPSVSGTIDAGTIPLDSFLGAKETGGHSGGSGNGSAGTSSGGGHWSREPIDTAALRSVDLDLGLSAQSITYGGWNLTKPATKIRLKDGTFDVDKLQSGLFGGTADVSIRVQDPADPKQPFALVLSTKMSNVDVEPLAYALSGSTTLKATGNASLDINVQTAGRSAYSLVSGLVGKATFNGKDVVMKGFDLAQIGLAFVDSGKPLDRVQSVVTGASAGGETRFDSIIGNYDISQGIVTITSMMMDGAAASIKSTGVVNLPQWSIDTTHTITFKQAKDAGAFDVKIKGPLDSPANTFGRGLFNDVLTKRLQQKVMDKLPDALGKNLTGKLQGLGILPQKQQQAIPLAPTTPADPNAVPASIPDPVGQPPVSATPAAPVEAQKSVKQQIKDDPAKAMQNILNGLSH